MTIEEQLQSLTRILKLTNDRIDNIYELMDLMYQVIKNKTADEELTTCTESGIVFNKKGETVDFI